MIEIKDLNFSFRRGFALKNINLKLENGTYALLGSNGAGKTTLMRCITGAYEYRGKIEILGKGLVGYLPQNIDFIGELTVFEMLEYVYCMKKIGPKADKKEIEACIEMTNLTEQRDKKVKSLSGGMRRRLGVAQAILGGPEVLIFDEPTAGLDPEERMRFKNLIHRLGRNDDKVIIISTHIVDDVVGNCDEIVVLKDGAVLEVAPEDEIKQYAAGKVFEAPDDDRLYDHVFVEKTIERKNGSFVRVLTARPGENFTEVEPTLEDGYLCLIKEI